MKTFEEWLDEHLSTPPDCDWYDPDGFSHRAVIDRWKESKIKSFWYETVDMLDDIEHQLKQFKGLRTPKEWFLQWLILPALPVLSLIRTIERVRFVLKYYERDYAKYVTLEQRKLNNEK